MFLTERCFMKLWPIFGMVFMLWSSVLTSMNSGSQVVNTNTNANVVHVVLTETKFTSDVTTFQKGVSYHFVVTNQGTVPMDLTITKALPASATEQQRDAAALKDVNQLPPSQTQEFDFVFQNAAPAGKLEFEDAH